MARSGLTQRRYELTILGLLVVGAALTLALGIQGPVAPEALVALLVLFAAAWGASYRGFERARYVAVLGMAVLYPLVEQEPYVSEVPNVVLALPAAVTVGLASARWVAVAGVLPWAIVIVRAGGGVHAKPLLLLAACFITMSMTLARYLMDRSLAAEAEARREAEVDRDRARAALEDLKATRREQEGLLEELQRRQRLESLGMLAGGIAHDFNNLLTGVSATGSLLREAPETRTLGLELTALSERGARLSKQLIAFAREQPLELAALDLAELMRGLTTMLDRILGDGVDVSLETPAVSTVVRGDRGQLEQLVTNLAVNARDAMRGEGSLGLVVRDGPDGTVELVVSDDGPGFPEEARGKLFDPFFSTKGSSGLGLATCFGITAKHGGTIEARDGESGGATFVVRLPTTDEEPSRQSQIMRRLGTPEAGTHVLLVEDEPAVRRATRRLLRAGGCVVTTATNGIDALEQLDGADDAPDVVVTDVSMPEMAGDVLAGELRRRWGDLPIVFVTGHLAQGDPRGTCPDAELVFKPFDGPTLLSAVERAQARRARVG